MRANIQRATGGALSTPAELHAKARDVLSRGQMLEAVLGSDEIALLARSFYAVDDEGFSAGERMAALRAPGTAQAMTLVAGQMGLELGVFQVAALVHMRRIASAFSSLGPGLGPEFAVALPWSVSQPGLGSPPTPAGPQASFNPSQQPSAWPATAPPTPGPGPPAPTRTDLFSAAPWAPTATPRDPVALFAADNTHLSGFQVLPTWSALPEAQKDAYRARSETLRREAWAATPSPSATAPSFTRQRPQRQPGQGFAALATRGQRLPGVPRVPGIVTGLKVFREEVENEGLEFQEVLRRWEELDHGQRDGYEARAAAVNANARVAYRMGRG